MFYYRSQHRANEISQQTGPVKPQLDRWAKKKEKHEQVAVGEKTSRSEKRMKAWLDDKEQRFEGRRN